MTAAAPGGAAPLLLRQGRAGDLSAVGERLLEAFRELRDGIGAGRAVVVLLDDGDLLGQGAPEDAAVANALLGMVRSLALEGASKGWRVNAVTTRGDGHPALAATVDHLGATPGLSGQLVRLGTDHLGRLAP